jgi:Integrase zinc binding domain/RNase H-like domain found in reverse transcriptase
MHEKELLAIIRALTKWQTDLLGSPIIIYTDHCTLENFDSQKDLSRRQAHWQEFLSHYDHRIVYIKGEDNTVADALSRLPDTIDNLPPTPVASMLHVETDLLLLQSILEGYKSDPFCIKLMNNAGSTPGLTICDNLLYVGDRLVIPRVSTLREDLFRLAHDNLGHFGFDKSYASLRNAYYWPNIRQDLEDAYIPACVDCQRNKSRTKKLTGPLHPLPIPDTRGDSIAIDFISPLPVDNGFDCIVTITDRLGADIRIAPTHVDITVEHFAALFFDLWYCENGLPLNIVSNRDKIFVSKFWKALHALTGVKLKMSLAYHPETDGSSERSNKTVIQALCYPVNQNQKNWVKALPLVCFNIMNTINSSTGFSPFQLRMGCSPRLIPPLISTNTMELANTSPEMTDATELLESIALTTAEAQDNLLAAKVNQADSANCHHTPKFPFKVGNKAFLSTEHRWHEYVQNKSGHMAKFMPRFDGPFKITRAHPETSDYSLKLPNEPNRFPTFHSSLLQPHILNDNELFESQRFAQPGPVLTPKGQEEWLIC